MHSLKANDFAVKSLGQGRFPSPLDLSKKKGDFLSDYVKEEEKVLLDFRLDYFKECQSKGIEPLAFRKAGPFEKIYFNPRETRAAIVTCGGLCPGLNDVIRGLVYQWLGRYAAGKILGVRYGYAGLIPENGHPLIPLTMDQVDVIQHLGGSVLGLSRGLQNVERMVNTLVENQIDVLFCIGGDGTLHGAHAIAEEIAKRNLTISIAGIPKTIDNDIDFIDRSFGFETAYSIAAQIIHDCHNEAKGYFNGIALIKLMGRDSGFIAAHASVAQQDVNFVIIPEMDFDLYGPQGFLETLQQRLEKRHHAVVVVAEGAGQFLFDEPSHEKDASGNRLHQDIGLLLKDKILDFFAEKDFPISLKYIDPSYIIRSAPSTPNDSLFCNQLAQHAVHAAIAGKTDFVVGNWGGIFTLLPISLAVGQRKKIDLESDFWGDVLGTTRQPASMKN